ncbi:PAS domain-containing protein [Aestuariispira ectoiniformans]|uniref:PAS domain-containing protein n=1 Tax=Aestuariispira ectoiniformans TaxID=2775080 RepID=UPI00223A9124|nr:PAS domain-containing protein [Aestuariispira ectoiniformans]
MTRFFESNFGEGRGDVELRDPRHRELYSYWGEKKGDRRVPRRADIDPVDIPRLLPNIFIFDVIREPRDYVLRLLGTSLVSVLGKDFTGAAFDKMYQGDTAKILRYQYDWIVDHWEPVYDRLDAAWMSKDYIYYDRLLLPLSDTGERVDKLLGCALFITSSDLEEGRSR